jgi:DNA-directed RNA polymerase subunit RPC12/RpoP
MKITDFLVLHADGSSIAADPHGNNVAFCCMKCGHPMLAVALEHQRGSDEEHPATCKRCSARYFLDVRQQAEKLYIHALGASA